MSFQLEEVEDFKGFWRDGGHLAYPAGMEIPRYVQKMENAGLVRRGYAIINGIESTHFVATDMGKRLGSTIELRK